MPKPTLRSERVVLVPQTLDQARALLEGGDPGLDLAPGYPHADTADGLRMWVEHGGPEDGGWFVTLADDGGWFVTLADDGRVVGDCGPAGPPDEEGRQELGYGLAAPFRGQGLGTEAVRVMADWLATLPEVRELTADVEVGNDASRRLLERLGFTVVGERDGHWQLSR